MNDTMRKVAERKIKEAMEKGEFDNLPGKGKPMNLDEDAHVPDDLRMAYKILKNANCTPPELEIRKEIFRIEDMLSTIKDEEEKYRQIKKLNVLVMKLNTMRPRPVHLEEQERYYSRVVEKISVVEKKDEDGGD